MFARPFSKEQATHGPIRTLTKLMDAINLPASAAIKKRIILAGPALLTLVSTSPCEKDFPAGIRRLWMMVRPFRLHAITIGTGIFTTKLAGWNPDNARRSMSAGRFQIKHVESPRYRAFDSPLTTACCGLLRSNRIPDTNASRAVRQPCFPFDRWMKAADSIRTPCHKCSKMGSEQLFAVEFGVHSNQFRRQ